MNIDHNRIKVADLEKNQPNKILATNSNGELEFSDINYVTSDAYNALDYTLAGKALDARQGKVLKDLIDTINAVLSSDNINLNTLQNLVDALEVVQNSLNTILVNDLTSGGATKALTAEMGKTLQTNKVDKVAGKSLLADTEISRLGTLSNYTHPANHPPSIITQDPSNRFVTDTEKATWNAKQSNIAVGTSTQYFRGDKTWQTLDKTASGLSNVDNTADAAKNVLSATKLTTPRTINGTAFDGSANITINAVDATPRIASSEKGVANGVATLDASGIIPTTQLPSYIDDVLEFTNLAGFPTTGETGKIYVAKDTNKTYRWSGTAYVFITSGAIDSVAGKTGVVTLAKADVGLTNVDNTADAAKNVLSATKLTTPRTINGVTFDGTANITINAVDSTPRIASSEKGVANGVATLDASGIIPTTQLPSYIDDVLEFTNLAGFPTTGETGKIYVAKDTNKTYRWGGSAYVYITSGAVDSVAGKTGLVTLVKADVGLSAVDNTADAAKNVLSATKLTTPRTINGVTFDGTANIVVADSTKLAIGSTFFIGTTSIANNRASASQGLTGISIDGNAATATTLQTARTINGVAFNGSANITINAVDLIPRIPSSEKGAANGVASLDASGIIPTTQLPSYVDDVVEYTNLAGFPATGETGKIYVAKDTNKTYRWGGSSYVYITSGAVDSVSGRTGVITLTKSDVGLGAVDNTTDASKNVLSATKLTTARTINGTAFDGTSNITIPINDTNKVPHQDGTRSALNYNTVLSSGFYNVDSTGTNGPGTSYNNLITVKGIDTGLQIAGGYTNDALWFRGWGASGTTFAPWRKLLHDGNYNSYSPALTGTGASGTWGINITGSTGGSSKYVDLLSNRTDVAAYPILWGTNQATNPITGNASTYAFSCDAVKIQSSTGTIIANNFSGSGAGLTGTAGSLSIGGNAATSSSSTRISFVDGPRTLSDRLPNSFARTVNFDFVNAGTVGGSGNYGGVMTFAPWDGLSTSTGDSSYQLAFRNESGVNGSGLPGLRLRKGIDTAWGGWYDMIHSGNYSSYSAFSGAITGASLTVSGDVTAFSDARVKENIRPILNTLERIQASRGVVYDRIDTKQKDNIGFIAQELEENFPELVLTREDGTKAVKYQNAVAVLFEAIKDQQSQIEELKELVTKLLKL